MSSLIVWKPPCRAVATTPVSSPPWPPSGPITIDGVSLVPGDRLLLTGQTSTPTRNGVWVIQSGQWTRPGDFNVASQQGHVTSGATYWIKEGSNANTVWTLTSADVISGTTPLQFAETSTALPNYPLVPAPYLSTQFRNDPTLGLINGAIADSSGISGGTLAYSDNSAALGAAISALVYAGAGELQVPYLGTGIYRIDQPLPLIDLRTAFDDFILDFHGATIYAPSTTLAASFDNSGLTNLPLFILKTIGTGATSKVIIRNLHLIGNDTTILDSTNLYAKNPTMYNSNLVYGGIWLDPRCQLDNVTVEGFAVGVALSGDHCLINEQCSFRNNTINLWYEKTGNQKDNIVAASYLSRARLASIGVHPFQDRVQDDMHGSCHLGLAPYGILRPKYGLRRNDGTLDPAVVPAWTATPPQPYQLGDIVSDGTLLYISLIASNSDPLTVTSSWQSSSVNPIFYSNLSNFSSTQAVDNSGDNVQLSDLLWILPASGAPYYATVGATSGTVVIGTRGFTYVPTTGSPTIPTTGKFVFAIQRAPGNYSKTEAQFIVNHVATDTTFENCGNSWIYDDTGVATVQWQGQDKPQFAGIDDSIQMPLGQSSSSAPDFSGTNGYVVTSDASTGGTNGPVFFTNTATNILTSSAVGEWLEILGISVASIVPTGGTLTVVTNHNHGLAVGDQILLTSLTSGTQGPNGEFGATVSSVTDSTHFVATRSGPTASFPGTQLIMVRQQLVALTIAGSSGTSGSEITLTVPQGDYEIGDSVIVAGHQANTGANGAWVISAVPSTTQITLKGSVYATGGSAGGYLYRRGAKNRSLAITNATGAGGVVTISTSPVKHGLSYHQLVYVAECVVGNANGSNQITSIIDDYSFTVSATGSMTGSGGRVFPIEGSSQFLEARARFFLITKLLDGKRVQLETDPMANCAGLAWRIVRNPRLGVRLANFNESAIHLGTGQSLYHAHELLWSLANAPSDLRIIFHSPVQPEPNSIWQTAGGLPPTIQVRNYGATDNNGLRTLALSGDREIELWQADPSTGTQLQQGDLAAHLGTSSAWQVQLCRDTTMNPCGIVLMDGGPIGSAYSWIATTGTIPQARFASPGSSSLAEMMSLDSLSPGGLAGSSDSQATLLQQIAIRVTAPLHGYAGAFLKPAVALQQDRVLLGPWAVTIPTGNTSTPTVMQFLGGTSGFAEWAALRSGYISGISIVFASAPNSSSGVGLLVTKNGAATTFGLTFAGTGSSRSAAATLAAQSIGFAQSDRLGVTWTASSFGASAIAAVVFVEVVM